MTQLNQELGPIYRGRLATELAREWRFEDVAELLWQSEGGGDWRAPDLGPCPARRRPSTACVGPSWCAAQAIRSVPIVDRRPWRSRRGGPRRHWPTWSARLPAGGDGDGSIAARLAARLTGTSTALPVAAVNAALVLLADHELATSTMAVRIAASVRADPYDAFLAGLVTLAGPLHGGASQQAYELLAMAERDGAARALDDVLRDRGIVPGFGHTVYKSGDPRFESLLALAEPLLSEERRALLREVMDIAAANDVPLANCDLALAALSWGTGMPPDTGRTLFAVARISGWAAHYMEELTERALRFRARAVYSST